MTRLDRYHSAVVSGESIVVRPLGPNRYYSVLAVDVKGNRSPL